MPDENMAKHIDEWGEPIEKEPAPLWFGILFLFLFWISGVILGWYLHGFYW